MDAFKLLTRSTRLKLHGAHERSPHPLPSEGPSGHLGAESGNGKKRKRDSDILENSHPANNASLLSPCSPRNGMENGDVKASNATNTQMPGSEIDGLPVASEDERRSILARHKIKVINLTKYHERTTKLTTSKDAQGNRKAQKAACQVFPPPLTSFYSLRTAYSVGRSLVENIVDQGYITPTEVQLAAIPLLLRSKVSGEDTNEEVIPHLLTVAPTGSGKTLAFLIPLIEKLTRQHHNAHLAPDQRHVSALIVAPTKELVGQIVNEGRKLTRRTGVRITAMRKGMILPDAPASAQLDDDGGDDSDGSLEIRNRESHSVVKSDILVTTPHLLVNAIANSQLPQGTLSQINSLILDEADVLLDPLFRDQTLALWNACTSPLLHVSFWSATIGSNIEELVLSVLQKRKSEGHLQTSTPLFRCVVGLKDSAISTILHKLIYAATEPGKLLGLRQLLHPPPAVEGRRSTPPLRPPFLVFTQTIERAIALHSELLYDIPSEAGGSSRIAVLHSDLSDSKRSDVMTRFQKGQIWVLITTDLLSRGVDFRGINGVVNYDIPTTSAAYVHRVGRTGRAGREGGVAVTFYTKDDIKYVKGIANAIAASEKGQRNVGVTNTGVQPWLLGALQDVSKKDKQKLKMRGVEVRRSIKGDEDKRTFKAKRKAKISTKGGYQRRLEKNRKGAMQSSQRRQRNSGTEDDEWGGIGD
jgi:ATP-dependent RNA helicase DDX52/ROK1